MPFVAAISSTAAVGDNGLGAFYTEISPSTVVNEGNGSAAALSVEVPAGAQEYDLLVARIFTRGNKFNAPAGWTLATEHAFGVTANPNGITTQIFYTLLIGANPGSVSFPRSISATATNQAIIDAYRRTNARQVTLVTAGSTANVTATNSFTGGSLTVNESQTLIIGAIGLGTGVGKNDLVLGDFAVANLANAANAATQSAAPPPAILPTDRWLGSYIARNAVANAYSCGYARHVPGNLVSTGSASATSPGGASQGAVSIAVFKLT